MNTNNIVFRNELNRIYKRIEKGDSINYAFNNSSFFDEEYKSYIIIANSLVNAIRFYLLCKIELIGK